MDYEKAYKNALERAKSIRFGDPNSATANVVCEEIFPELKESEDERIRKTLCEIIIDYDPNNEILIKEVGVSQKQFLAWLEKQGEQNLAWSDEDEKMMQFILKYVNALASNFDYENIQIWFRNLKNRVQPQWKPTKAQMNALYWMKQNPAGKLKKSILDSLYDDLKKL